MMRAVQKYKVTLLGQPYTFVSDEAEALVQAAIQLLETTVKDVAGQSASGEMHKVALLSALSLALQHVQLQQDVAAHNDQQAKLMSLLTDVDLSTIE